MDGNWFDDNIERRGDRFIKIRPLMDGNLTSIYNIIVHDSIKIRPLMDGNKTKKTKRRRETQN